MVVTLSDKVQKLAEVSDEKKKEKGRLSSLCSACAGQLPGSVRYYCKNATCTSFPLCMECICTECGCCPDCEECGDPNLASHGSSKGKLFCASCGQVEEFTYFYDAALGEKVVVCSICSKEYTMNTAVENLYLEGVDYDFQRLVHGESSGKEEEKLDDDLLLFCSGCFQNTQHKDKYISIIGGQRTEHFQCLTCQKDREGKTRKLADGSFLHMSQTPAQRASLASTYHKNNTTDTYGYGGYNAANRAGYGDAWGYCPNAHWRDPIKIGEWTVYVSASSDQPTPTELAAIRGRPLVPDYGLYFATDRSSYGIGWGATVQTTPDFPVEELGLSTVYPRLFYDWQDMGAPRGAIVIRLVEWAIEKIKAGKKIDLGCFGGHGRTGTFLALLFIEMEGMSATEAMQAVWSRHCDQAIETYAQKKFIYEFNGERAPAAVATVSSNINSGVTKPTSKPSNYQYPSKLKRKELKSARRRTRVEIKACVTDAITAGVTSRKVFEAEGTIWMCSKCGHIKLGGVSFGGQRDAKWVIWCQGCYETNQHLRPESLFDLLEE